jgi:hypothetical protein
MTVKGASRTIVRARCVMIARRKASVGTLEIGFGDIEICLRHSSGALSKTTGSFAGSRLRNNTGC